MKAGSKQLQDYQDFLNSLCDLAPDNDELLHILKSSRLESWREDYQFYLNMKAIPQIGCMTSPDTALQKKIQRSQERERLVSQRQDSEKQRCTSAKRLYSEADLTEDPAEQEPATSMEDVDYEYQPTAYQQYKMSQRAEKVLLELPTYDIAKATAVLTARLKVSTNVALTLFAKMINLGGGDVHDFILSRTTVWRQRIAGETQAAEKIYEKYQSLLKDPLTYCVLQWDGKKIEYADGETHDRLCILLHTLPSGRSQFIGAPRTPNGTGTAQCEAILRYTDQWNVADRVIGMIWDTTASNTGRQKGSAVLYEEALEHALLWIACRHHVSELHVHWADQTVRGVHKGMLSSWQHYMAQLSVWC